MKKMQTLARALQPKNKSLARLITSAADNNFQVNLVKKLVANKIPFEMRNGTVDVVTASDLSPEGKKLLMENYGFKPEDFAARKPLASDPFKTGKISTTDVDLNEPDPFRNTNNKNVGGESHKRGNPFTLPKAGAVSASVKCPHCGTMVKAAGEMFQEELEKGGDWYEVRLELEQLCKKAGLPCKVRPFDQYQGPFAETSKGRIFLTDEGYFFEDKNRKNQQTLDEVDMVKFLKGLK